MKKIKMPLSTLIINIVITVFVITSIILLIIGYEESYIDIKDNTKISYVFMLIALFALIILMNVTMFFKKIKIYILIPVLAIYLILPNIVSYIILFISSQAGSEITNPETTNQVLELAIFTLFVVSALFALKDKKWAIITIIVILALNIYSMYANIVLFNSMLVVIEDMPWLEYNPRNDYSDTVLMLYGLGITVIAQVIYFVSLLYPKTEQQVAEPVISEEVVSEEPVNPEVVEPVSSEE